MMDLVRNVLPGWPMLVPREVYDREIAPRVDRLQRHHDERRRLERGLHDEDREAGW